MRVQTSAMGRALGAAGILVLGTGVASADDMQEYVASPEPTPSLPPTSPAAKDPDERLAQLRAQALALQTQMQEEDRGWPEFAAWWAERAKVEGWSALNDVPLEALAGVVERMGAMYAHANEQTGVAA
jgi:hypothetical protein